MLIQEDKDLHLNLYLGSMTNWLCSIKSFGEIGLQVGVPELVLLNLSYVNYSLLGARFKMLNSRSKILQIL